jgi:hypothetical protein
MRNHGNNFKHIQLPQEKHINVQQSINQNFISSNSGGFLLGFEESDMR